LLSAKTLAAEAKLGKTLRTPPAKQTDTEVYCSYSHAMQVVHVSWNQYLVLL
jgi:hypothetical protein